MTQEEQNKHWQRWLAPSFALCRNRLEPKAGSFRWRMARRQAERTTADWHLPFQLSEEGRHWDMRGTLRTDLIPAEFQPHGNERSRNFTARAYFDLDRQAWRSYSVETSQRTLDYEPVIWQWRYKHALNSEQRASCQTRGLPRTKNVLPRRRTSCRAQAIFPTSSTFLTTALLADWNVPDGQVAPRCARITKATVSTSRCT